MYGYTLLAAVSCASALKRSAVSLNTLYLGNEVLVLLAAVADKDLQKYTTLRRLSVIGAGHGMRERKPCRIYWSRTLKALKYSLLKVREPQCMHP